MRNLWIFSQKTCTNGVSFVILLSIPIVKNHDKFQYNRIKENHHVKKIYTVLDEKYAYALLGALDTMSNNG